MAQMQLQTRLLAQQMEQRQPAEQKHPLTTKDKITPAIQVTRFQMVL